MDTETMDNVLVAAKLAQHDTTLANTERKVLWRKLHAIAEVQYVPAVDFFVSSLENSDWEWRLDALQCLGFHYDFPADGSIVERIRHLLLTDTDGFGLVRMAAAAVLGLRSTWPEAALKSALRSDPDEQVRRSAFSALLDLAGVPVAKKRCEVEKVEAGDIRPTWEEVERILAEEGIDLAKSDEI